MWDYLRRTYIWNAKIKIEILDKTERNRVTSVLVLCIIKQLLYDFRA